MPTPNYTPELIRKTRYASSFEVLRGYLNHPQHTSPSGEHDSGLLYSNTVWKAGTVLTKETATGFVKVAASGEGDYFALQHVSDMSGLNGYRNLQNTGAARGDVIGAQFGQGMAATSIHAGVGNPGDIGYWAGDTLRFVASGSYVAANHGKALCRLEHADGTQTNRSLVDASATFGDKDTESSIKAIITFDIPLVHIT